MANLFQKSKHFGKPEVLLVGDHFTSMGAMHAKASLGNPGLASLVDGRYIVPAGTIYPSNDALAVGVVANDYDVTDGDVNMSVITHGIIKTAALPEHASAAAKLAMQLLSFFPPSAASNISRWLAFVVAYIGEGDAALAEEVKVTLELDAGARFVSAAAAENLSNWTVTGGAATKLEVVAIELLEDNKVELELGIQSAQSAAVGSLSVRPSTAIISNGQAPAAAVIAEVPAFWADVIPLSITAGIEVLDNMEIELVIEDPNATFASEAAAENTGNWTVSEDASTDIELKSISYIDEKTVVVTVGLEAAGKTVAGTISITPKDAALTGEAGLVAIDIAVVA